MNADVEKSVERIRPDGGMPGSMASQDVAAWRLVRQALRDQEAEIDRLRTNENLDTLQYNRMLAKYEGAESRAAKADGEIAVLREALRETILVHVVDDDAWDRDADADGCMQRAIDSARSRITAHLGANHD